jgi:hypothetical protein
MARFRKTLGRTPAAADDFMPCGRTGASQMRADETTCTDDQHAH